MEIAERAPRGEPLWSSRSLLLLIVGAVGVATVLHYLTGAHLLEYHTVYRSLYYLPIAGAAVAFGLRGGLFNRRGCHAPLPAARPRDGRDPPRWHRRQPVGATGLLAGRRARRRYRRPRASPAPPR